MLSGFWPHIMYVSCIFAFFTSLCIFHVMESLSSFGVNLELSRQEFLRKLLRYSDEGRLVSLRDDLFASAVASGLADTGDALVTRRKVGGGNSLKEKHVDDIWVLVRAFKQKAPVPRVLLKNGKRSKSGLSQSQARQVSKLPTTVLPN